MASHALLSAASRPCTPSACTWGQVAHQYASPGFAVGLAAVVAAVLLFRAALRRRRGH